MISRVFHAVVLSAAVSATSGAQDLLVSAPQLARELRDPKLVLLQVGPLEEYNAGHVPGARLVTLADLSAPRRPDALPLELPDEQDLRTRLEKLGISDDSRVVVIVGADWVSPATRAVWTLQVAGLGGRTRMLSGGSGAWKRAGLEVTRDAPPAAKPGRLTLKQDRSIVVDNAWVTSQKQGPSFRLIDAREPVFFEGPGMKERDHVMTAGHIAGARNFPFNTVTDDSLHFLSPAELRARFATLGVQPGDTVVAYCHIGQQATAVLFAARLAGFAIRLYDGSMADWEARKLPLENARP